MATAVVTGASDGIFQAEGPGAPITLGVPLTLANQASAPATPTGSAVLYSSGGVVTYINPQGLVQTIVGSQGGLTAAASAITSTTSEAVLQSMSLPANDAIAGAVYKMVGWGVFSTTGSPGNTVFTTRLGGTAGTSLAATANITLGTSLTNAQFEIETLLNFLSATSATAVMRILVNSAVGGAASPILSASTAAVTVSLSSTKSWVLDITPGASGNSIQLLGGWSERVA